MGHRGHPPRRRGRARTTWGAGKRATDRARRWRRLSLSNEGTGWGIARKNGTGPFRSSDPDTARIWWTDVGGAPEHDLPGPARPHFGRALLAPGGAGDEGGGHGSVRRHFGRHRQVARGLPRVADADTPRCAAFARWNPAPVLAAASGAPGPGCLQASMELYRALGSLIEVPAPEHRRIADALGLPGVPAAAVHGSVVAFQRYPYASVYLGAEGMMGGEARDRIAGFQRALGLGKPTGSGDAQGGDRLARARPPGVAAGVADRARRLASRRDGPGARGAPRRGPRNVGLGAHRVVDRALSGFLRAMRLAVPRGVGRARRRGARTARGRHDPAALPSRRAPRGAPRWPTRARREARRSSPRCWRRCGPA